MTSEWKTGKLSDFLQLKRGYDLPQRNRTQGSVPLVSSSGVTDVHNTSMVKGPGVVTGRYGTIGEVFYVEEDFWPLNTTLYVKDFKGNNPRFIYYFMKTFDFQTYSDKAAVPGVNRNHLHEAVVRVPPLNIQKSISDCLTSLDEVAETLRKQNATLEAIAQTLFKSWFVNFDPVHTKAAGETPEGMSPELAALFPSEFEESELGLIPKGWQAVPFTECITIHSGGTPKTSVAQYWNGDIPWFSVVDSPLDGQVFVHSTTKNITRSGLENSPAKLLPSRCSIVSARGTVGKVAMTNGSMTINQSCFALSPKHLCGEYWVYLQLLDAVKTLQGFAHGGVFDTITRATFESVRVIQADEAIHKKFNSLMLPLFDQIANNGQSILALSKIRDELLPRLISGKIRIEEAEEAVAGVLGEMQQQEQAA